MQQSLTSSNALWATEMDELLRKDEPIILLLNKVDVAYDELKSSNMSAETINMSKVYITLNRFFFNTFLTEALPIGEKTLVTQTINVYYFGVPPHRLDADVTTQCNGIIAPSAVSISGI